MNTKKQSLFDCLVQLLYPIYSKIASIIIGKKKNNILKITPAKRREPTVTLYDIEYYNLIKNLRNCKLLSKTELLYIESLPKNNLLELINIYNDDLKMLTEAFIDSP